MSERGRGNYRGNNKPGAITIPPHAHPLVREFFAAMNAQGRVIADVSLRSGVGRDTLRMWRWRHMPRLDMFVAALNTIGLELTIRPIAKADEAGDAERVA